MQTRRYDDRSETPPSTPTVARARAGDSAREAVTTVGADPLPAQAGTIIPPGASLGRYVVVGTLGRGAMGTVLRAYDPKLHREVALKRLRADLPVKGGQARMVREARAMAQLSHPNVVAVYDVDVVDESVILAMELVGGRTLSQWSRQRRPAPRAILAAYRLAGAGLAAAHHAGLVHRDFKPDNVLVVGEPGTREWAVKVTDFGLAKATRSLGSSGELENASGERLDAIDIGITAADVVVGTPRYMAPEQSIGEPAQAASDQYAFCVALWEALVGAPPFVGNTVDELAAAKHIGPPAWPGVPGVRREIGEAIQRGLAVDPRHRHAGMPELLLALSRRPARHRWMIAGAALAASTLTLAFVLGRGSEPAPCSGARARVAEIWDDAARARIEAGFGATALAYAPLAMERATEQLDAYADGWTAAHNDACLAHQVRGEQSAELHDQRMACLSEARSALSTVITLLGAADPVVVAHAGELVEGLPPLSQCDDVERLLGEAKPPEPALAARVAEAHERLAGARALYDAGHPDRAEPELVALQAEAAEIGYAPLRAEVGLELGSVLRDLGRPQLAETTLRDAEHVALASGAQRTAARVAAKLAEAISNDASRADHARWEAGLALDLAQAREPGGLLEAIAHRAFGRVSRNDRDHVTAERELRVAAEQLAIALGDEHSETLLAWGEHAGALGTLGRVDEARQVHERVLAILLRTLGPEHPAVATEQAKYADCLHASGEYEAAAAIYRNIIARHRERLGDAHPLLGSWHYNLGNALQSARRWEEAELAYRDAIAHLTGAYGRDHVEVATVRNNLANTLYSRGALAEAEVEHRESLRIRQEVLGPDHPRVAIARTNVAMLLLARGHAAEAEREYRTAADILARALGPGHPDSGRCLAGAAEALLAQGRTAEAIATWEQALATMRESPTHGLERGAIRVHLAHAFARQPDGRMLALAQAQAALAEFTARGAAGEGARRELEDWLATMM